jgi:nicotinamide mononucleotide adenylyltransferase
VSDIQANGLYPSDVTPQLLSGFLNGTGLAGDIKSILTSSDPYTASSQQQKLAGYLVPNQVVIGAYYFGFVPDASGQLQLKTHAKAMQFQGGQVQTWNPEPGAVTSTDTAQNAYQQLVSGWQGNNNPLVGRSTYIVVIHHP